MVTLNPETIPTDFKDRLAQAYNAIAPQYNTFTIPHDTLRLKRIRTLLASFPPQSSTSSPPEPRKALELGCGACGPATRLLLEHGFHLTGNDLSSAQLDLARKNNADFASQLELIEADMMSLSFPEASLDAVVAFYSIIHLPRDEQAMLIQRIASWLKPGGIFLPNFGNKESDGTVMEEWLGQKEGWMYWSGWGGEKSVEMVEDAGLEVLVNEVSRDVADSDFVWVVGRKK